MAEKEQTKGRASDQGRWVVCLDSAPAHRGETTVEEPPIRTLTGATVEEPPIKKKSR